jgi:hypothetical protein
LIDTTRAQPPQGTRDVDVTIRWYTVLVGPPSDDALTQSVVGDRHIPTVGIPGSCLSSTTSTAAPATAAVGTLGLGPPLSWLYAVVGEQMDRYSVLGVATSVVALMIMAGQWTIGLARTSTSMQPRQSTWWYDVSVAG